MLSKLAKYRKAVVGVVGFLVTVGGAFFIDTNWFAPLVTFLSAVGVYQVPNEQ